MESNKWIDAMKMRKYNHDGQYGMGLGRPFLLGCMTLGEDMANGLLNQAFLNVTLDEDIYMVQPEGFVESLSSKESMQASNDPLYGLMHAFKKLEQRFDEEI
ncbi:hypothetical protein Tco_1504588 [Tanacetum coccineum]